MKNEHEAVQFMCLLLYHAGCLKSYSQGNQPCEVSTTSVGLWAKYKCWYHHQVQKGAVVSVQLNGCCENPVQLNNVCFVLQNTGNFIKLTFSFQDYIVHAIKVDMFIFLSRGAPDSDFYYLAVSDKPSKFIIKDCLT